MEKQDVATLWAVMYDIFGKTWVNNFGKVPNPTWCSAMEGKLTAAQLRRGVDTVLELGLEYPPPLPRFLAYCRRGADNVTRPQIPESEVNQLPRLPTSEPAKVEKFMQELRHLTNPYSPGNKKRK